MSSLFTEAELDRVKQRGTWVKLGLQKVCPTCKQARPVSFCRALQRSLDTTLAPDEPYVVYQCEVCGTGWAEADPG